MLLDKKETPSVLMILSREGIPVHISVLPFWGFWGFSKNTAKIGNIANFGKFPKMPPPLQKRGLLKWV